MSASAKDLVEEPEPGVWLIRTATVIPDNELWLHQPKAADDLRRALAWARANPPSDTDTDAFLARVEGED